MATIQARLMTPEEVETDPLISSFKAYESFHIHPTQTNFSLVMKVDGIYRNKCPEAHQCFLGEIYALYKLGSRTEEEQSKHERKIKRLTGFSSDLSPTDLDCLWALWYASGNLKYPRRVKRVSNDMRSRLEVREAAKWSFNCHVMDGRIPKDT